MTQMVRVAIRVVMAAAVCGLMAMPAAAQTPEVQKLLAEIKAKDKGLLAVSEEDGRFLRLMIASSGAKHALEIGGASGYSAIWIGMGLRETGGHLVTIEYDPVRAKELAENIKQGRAVRYRAGRRRRRLPADPEGRRARSTSSSSMRGRRTTSVFSTWSCRGSTSAGCSLPTMS